MNFGVSILKQKLPLAFENSHRAFCPATDFIAFVVAMETLVSKTLNSQDLYLRDNKGILLYLFVFACSQGYV